MVPRCRDVVAQAQHQQAEAWDREGAGGSSSKEDEATAAAVTTTHDDECSAMDPPMVNIHYNVRQPSLLPPSPLVYFICLYRCNHGYISSSCVCLWLAAKSGLGIDKCLVNC